MEAVRADSEEMRNTLAMNSQVAKTAAASGQDSPSNIPSEVATPFPP